MAKINSFEEKVQFQGSAKGGSFDPYNVPDPNAGLQGKLNAINQSFDNIEKGQALKYGDDARYLEQLARFSETLTDSVDKGLKFYAGYEQEQADMLFAEDLRAQELARMDLEAKEQKIQEIDAVHTQEASNLIAAGAPPEIVQRMKDLGGLRGYYYKRNAAAAAGKSYEGWLTEKLANDTSLITINGVEKPVNSPDWEPPEQAFILKSKLSEFYKEYGLDQISRGLLAKYTLPGIQQVESKMMGKFRLGYAVRKSEEDRTEATNNLFAALDPNNEGANSIDVSAFINKVGNTYDERGNPIGRSAAWKMLGETLVTGVKTCQISSAQVDQILNTEDPVTRKTLLKSRSLWAFDLRSKIAAADREKFQEQQAEDTQRAKQFEDDVLAQWQSRTDVSEEEIHMAQKTFFDLSGGSKSSAIETYQSSFSVSAEGKRRLNDQFEKLAEQGLLTPEMVLRAPWDVRSKWESVAAKQAEATDQSSVFKDHMKAIEGQVKVMPGLRASPDGTTSGMAVLVTGELKAKFRRKVAEKIGMGIPAKEAADRSVEEVFSEMKVNPRYQLDGMGEFSNFFPKGTAARTKAFTTNINKIRKKLEFGGKASLDKTAGLIFNEAELRQIEKGYGQPGWSVPPEASYWASQLNMNPLELINRQRTAAGLKGLSTPASIERVQRTISPEFQALLNRYQTPNRSTRALASMGRFDPTMIKNGYGQVVQQAAQKHGIDPSILAGVIETESGWNPNARSKYARGIAQIVPESHPGVNYNDPIESINYAAKYISQLQRQFGGDMKLALIAYNAGPGNVEKYRGPIPGDSESGAYYGKVMKAAGKYGYGAAWNDPSTRRGKFRVIEYLTGDPNHDAFRADHGGSNYHEHLAFSTPAEAKAAAAKLKAAGIKVTELKSEGPVGTHSKNSYHYSGMAFDVPASQVPVGKEKELSRRVRSILGLS